MEIRELQAHAQELRSQQGWQDTSLERRLAFLLSEMGEVAQEVLTLMAASGETEREQAKMALGLEIYDVFWNLCDLANLVGLDLEEAFNKKYAINQQRTW